MRRERRDEADTQRGEASPPQLREDDLGASVQDLFHSEEPQPRIEEHRPRAGFDGGARPACDDRQGQQQREQRQYQYELRNRQQPLRRTSIANQSHESAARGQGQVDERTPREAGHGVCPDGAQHDAESDRRFQQHDDREQHRRQRVECKSEHDGGEGAGAGFRRQHDRRSNRQRRENRQVPLVERERVPEHDHHERHQDHRATEEQRLVVERHRELLGKRLDLRDELAVSDREHAVVFPEEHQRDGGRHHDTGCKQPGNRRMQVFARGDQVVVREPRDEVPEQPAKRPHHRLIEWTRSRAVRAGSISHTSCWNTASSDPCDSAPRSRSTVSCATTRP